MPSIRTDCHSRRTRCHIQSKPCPGRASTQASMALYEAYIARRERRVRLISPKLTKEDGSTWRL